MSESPVLISPSHFEKVCQLGTGSIGKVYLAKEKTTQRQFAIKFIKTDLNDNNETTSHVNMIAQMRHLAILRPFGYSLPDHSKKRPMSIVTEYQKNGSLASLFSTPDLLTDFLRMKILFGVAEALRFIHENRFVHGNLTPGNILLTSDWEPVLTDYFIGKFAPKARKFPQLSFCFQAPEFNCDNDLAPSVDVFSYGMIVYSVISNRLPFNENTSDIHSLILRGERPPLSSNIPECWQHLISQCWDNDPMKRPSFESIVLRFMKNEFFLPLKDIESIQMRNYQTSCLSSSFATKALINTIDQIESLTDANKSLNRIVESLKRNVEALSMNMSQIQKNFRDEQKDNVKFNISPEAMPQQGLKANWAFINQSRRFSTKQPIKPLIETAGFQKPKMHSPPPSQSGSKTDNINNNTTPNNNNRNNNENKANNFSNATNEANKNNNNNTQQSISPSPKRNSKTDDIIPNLFLSATSKSQGSNPNLLEKIQGFNGISKNDINTTPNKNNPANSPSNSNSNNNNGDGNDKENKDNPNNKNINNENPSLNNSNDTTNSKLNNSSAGVQFQVGSSNGGSPVSQSSRSGLVRPDQQQDSATEAFPSIPKAPGGGLQPFPSYNKTQTQLPRPNSSQSHGNITLKPNNDLINDENNAENNNNDDNNDNNEENGNKTTNNHNNGKIGKIPTGISDSASFSVFKLSKSHAENNAAIPIPIPPQRQKSLVAPPPAVVQQIPQQQQHKPRLSLQPQSIPGGNGIGGAGQSRLSRAQALKKKRNQSDDMQGISTRLSAQSSLSKFPSVKSPNQNGAPQPPPLPLSSTSGALQMSSNQSLSSSGQMSKKLSSGTKMKSLKDVISAGQVQFPYAYSPFDGIFMHLSQEVRGNLCEKGIISITGNSADKNRESEIQQIINYDWGKCWTSANVPNSYIQFDFGVHQICITHYTIKTYPCGAGYSHLKNWVIEGCNTGQWYEIDRREDNNELNGKNRVATYEVAATGDFQMIRLRQTGPNHYGDNYLILTNIEFFGDFI